MLAGKYHKQIDLDPGAKVPVHMDLFADAPKYLEATDEQIKPHRQMVQQMYKLYGAHHYGHYTFLTSLSDKLGGIGLEHHQSSEDGVKADYFTEWKKNALSRDLFSHEYNHSWDGKYRRGADLTTPNFNVPMSDTLLWVYEGPDPVLGLHRGRACRPVDRRAGARHARLRRRHLRQGPPGPGQLAQRAGHHQRSDHRPAFPLPYRNYQASEDYYVAGAMIWLDVDAKLRELSGGKNSIDDFAKAFFGMNNGDWKVNPYTFEDVVKTLNDIKPFDWASFLRTRLDGHGPLIGGIAAHGWKLTYTDKPSDAIKAIEARRGNADLTYSLGLSRRQGRRHRRRAVGRPGVQGGHRSVDVGGGGQRHRVFGRCTQGRGHRRGQGQVQADRAAAEELRQLQDRAHRLPRRSEVPAPGARLQQAGHADPADEGPLSPVPEKYPPCSLSPPGRGSGEGPGARRELRLPISPPSLRRGEG